MEPLRNRTLFFGDNLEILREKIPDESFDLIYLDPPFNSNRNYNVLFKEGLQDSPSQVQAFEDSWHWTRDAQETFEELAGVRTTKAPINEKIINLMQALEKLVGHNDVLAYLTMMTVRLLELHRVLKPTGSIYLHCDPTASHYLKIVMDAIFGKQNFRNEIVWCYTGPSGAKNDFPKKHDTILRYSKTDNYYSNLEATRIPYKELHTDKGAGAKIWGSEGKLQDETVRQEYLKRGKIPEDFWVDIPSGGHISPNERLGYPTQKPETLLERIVKASSNEMDWVLDPFCGCGTTVSVAERLKRNWVGIDITMLAINLIRHRLAKQFEGKMPAIYIDGRPRDVASAQALFKKDPFEFEYWVLDMVDAVPAQSKTKEHMRGADKGIDGVITFVKDLKNGNEEYGRLLVQVKGGGVHRNDIATLKGDVERERAEGGVLITLEKPTKPMLEEAASAGSYKVKFGNEFEFPKIQILTVDDLLNNKKPRVPLGALRYYKEAKPVEEKNRDKELGI
ncbi:MAG: DNA methyltransferase [Candidatus Jorgensenbacteria bacterium]